MSMPSEDSPFKDLPPHHPWIFGIFFPFCRLASHLTVGLLQVSLPQSHHYFETGGSFEDLLPTLLWAYCKSLTTPSFVNCHETGGFL